MQQFFSFLILISLSCNGNAPKKNVQGITGATIHYHIPILQQNGTVDSIQSSFQVYFLDNMVFYIFHQMFDSTISGKVVEHGFRDEYFLYRKRENIGQIYNPTHPTRNRKASVDSILNTQTFTAFNWGMILA